LFLVIGVFITIYFINRKERKIGRAFLITLVALLLGVALGTVLGGLLGASGLMFGLASEQVACFVAFLFFWIASSFLR
jgi:predicted membrane-bound mannosyltransferase